MGKKAAKPPPAPDPVKTAQAQTDSNINTARANANLNRLDETDPMGSVRYTDLGNDRWRKDTSLSPIGQEQFNLQNQVDAGTNRLALQGVGQAGKVLGQSFSLDGLTPERAPGLIGWGDVQRNAPGGGPIQASVADGGQIRSDFGDVGQVQGQIGDVGRLQRSVGPNDFSADRQRVEQAIMARMQPQLDQGRAKMEQRLADQGIPAGSEAYNRQMDALGRQENDAMGQAILAGGQEQSRLFGMDLDRGSFANQAQQTAFGQEMGRVGFGNEAQQQRYGQELGRAGFANEAQGQRFGQGVTQGEFANNAQNLGFGQGMQGAQFANSATGQMINQQSADKADWANTRQRELQELLLGRSQPINEIGALLGTGQVGMPSFQQATPVNVAGTDVMSPINNQYAGQMAGWNAKNQAKQGFQNGLFGLAGAAGSAAIMSDRRVKEGIRRIGTADNGIPLYSYRYIGHPAVHVGTMAQDVEADYPDAVVEFDGIKHVDYGKLFN
jgi:hypothetical protein